MDQAATSDRAVGHSALVALLLCGGWGSALAGQATRMATCTRSGRSTCVNDPSLRRTPVLARPDTTPETETAALSAGTAPMAAACGLRPASAWSPPRRHRRRASFWILASEEVALQLAPGKKARATSTSRAGWDQIRKPASGFYFSGSTFADVSGATLTRSLIARWRHARPRWPAKQDRPLSSPVPTLNKGARSLGSTTSAVATSDMRLARSGALQHSPVSAARSPMAFSDIMRKAGVPTLTPDLSRSSF
jgi:hypothetical protein